MVLPEERNDQFINKMRSPLFKDHFENENWNLVYFDTLKNEYIKKKSEIDIFTLINKKSKINRVKDISDRQLLLFKK